MVLGCRGGGWFVSSVLGTPLGLEHAVILMCGGSIPARGCMAASQVFGLDTAGDDSGAA